MQFQDLQGGLKIMQLWRKRELMGDGSLEGMCISSTVLRAQNLLFVCESSPSLDPVAKKDVSSCILKMSVLRALAACVCRPCTDSMKLHRLPLPVTLGQL